METIYERIERLCQERGIRPGALCSQLGLSRSLITDLKMGRKKGMRTETAQKIATYFGISVEALVSAQTESPALESNSLLEDVDVAFYGQYRELSEEDKETIRDMVHLLRRRRTANQRE